MSVYPALGCSEHNDRSNVSLAEELTAQKKRSPASRTATDQISPATKLINQREDAGGIEKCDGAVDQHEAPNVRVRD